MHTFNLGLLSGLAESTHRSTMDRLLPYPPICAEYEGHLFVVDGVKRCKGSRIMPPILFEKHIKRPEEQIIFWLNINLSYRRISEMEKAFIINVLNSLNMKEQYIAELMQPYMDINKSLIRQYCSYMALPANIRRYIDLHCPAKNFVRFIMAIKKEILESIDKLVGYIEPNPATLKTIACHSNDIFLKTGENILESEEIAQRLANSGLKGLVDFVEEKRFPRVNLVRKNIESELKTLDVSIAKVNYDHSLETDGLNINASIKNAKDLKKFIGELEILEKNNLIKRINDAKNSI